MIKKILHYKKNHKHHLRNVLFAILSAFLIFSGLFFVWVSSFTMPDLQSFEQRKVAESTKIYDRTGKILLYDVNQGIRRTVVPFADISQNIKNATIAIEDETFYTHHGIKLTSIVRAILANIGAGGYSQGGSTITQQVVKNALLTGEKSIVRKLKEIVLSLKLERMMTKDQIFSVYLNETPYGGSLYGVEEASLAFFGKSSKDLDIAESAYIAALPQAPTYYSPYGNHMDALVARKNLVLSRMLANKFITQDEYNQARKEVVIFAPPEEMGIRAPHFVFFIKDYLTQKYGEDVVNNGGLKVITTLDYAMEQKAEDVVKKFALDNAQKYNASNAALVAISPKTGQILTMVGSRDYFDQAIDGNFNIALAHRQPGSSFKPFVYATAFNKGYTPDTVVFDLPTEFDTNCTIDGKPLPNYTGNCYMPVNYDGNYRGPMTLRNALAQSINIPAIKTLYLAGITDSLSTAKSMGIASLGDANQYGLTLVLGGGEVSLLDMTSAYSVFANNGVRNPYTGILNVTTSDGQVLESYEQHSTEVLPEQSALKITDILSDEIAREPAYGVHSVLYFPNRPVAVKTGTTNDYKDAWILGYTPSVAVGAWAGNNDNTPMEKKVAGFIIAPLWNAFMTEIFKDMPVENFKKPDPETNPETLPAPLQGVWQGGKTYVVDKISGKLATQYTPVELREVRAVTNVHSILYWINKDDPRGGIPADPTQDPQFFFWETPILKWVVDNHIVNQNDSVIPTTYDDVHLPQYFPKITVLSPTSEGIYTRDQKISVQISEIGKYPLSKVDYFVNGQFAGTVSQFPFSFSFDPNDISSITEENVLKVVGYDSVSNKNEVDVNFKISL